MTKPIHLCEVCNTAFGDRWEVTCDGPCGKPFHALCADLNMTHLNAWTAKVGLRWFCPVCRLDFDTGVRRRESILQAAIREMFGEVQRTVRDLALRVDSMDAYLRQPKQVDSVEGDEPVRDVEIIGAQKIDLDAVKSSNDCGEFAAERCVDTEPEQELIIASTYDTPATCTDRKDLVTVSVVEKPEAQVSAKIWAKIFRHLSVTDLYQIRLVCSAWKKIVDADHSLLDRFSFTSITFNERSIFNVGSWWIPEITGNLVQLKLKNCEISLITLLELLRSTTNLSSLSLSCGSTLAYSTTVDKYANLRLEKMETLQIDFVKQEEVLKVLWKLFPRLKDFKLLSGYDKCYPEVNEMIKSIESLEGVALPSSCRVLSDLAAGVKDRLKRVSVVVPHYSDLSKQIISFSQMQPSLECFDLIVEGRISTIANSQISGQQYENRKEYNLNDKTLTEVFQNLRKLKQLSMKFSVSRTASSICRVEVSAEINLQSLSSLTELECLSFNGVRTEKFDYQLISFHGARNPKLKELQLGCVTSPSTPSRFALQDYIANAPNLRVISLDSCCLNCWSDVFAPTHQPERIKLTKVRVRNATEYCPLDYLDQVRYLELTDCQMSEDVLATLLCLSPQVEELYLAQMEHAGDAVILMIREKMKQLRVLTLDQCPITDAAVGHIMVCAGKLEQLTIRSCRALSAEAKSSLEGAKILRLKIE